MTEKTRYKVLLVDDHPVVLSGIITEAAKKNLPCDIDTSHSVTEARRKLQLNEYDFIQSDLSLPDGSGLDFLKSIRKTDPGIKLAVLTMLRDWNLLNEAKRIQLNGYMLKDQTTESLVDCIEKIMNGEFIFPDESPPQSLQNKDQNLIEKYESLTEREKDILDLILDGFMNKEVAEKLDLSIRTVETHRASIMKKLNAKNSISLAVYRNIIRQ